MNEEKGIALTIAELDGCLTNFKVMVIDGNSGDGTVAAAKSLGATVILQEGTGKGDALFSGLKNMDNDIDYVVITDADFTYPAEFIQKMLKIVNENPKVGMVCGNRFNIEYPLDMNKVFRFGNKVIASAHTILNGVSLSDPLTGLRVIRADLLREWVPVSTNFDIEVELNLFIKRSGFEIVEIPISYRQRIGEKKLKMKHGLTILKRIIYECFS
jgi:dolichol-phosphate mannosyltransferase